MFKCKQCRKPCDGRFCSTECCETYEAEQGEEGTGAWEDMYGDTSDGDGYYE